MDGKGKKYREAYKAAFLNKEKPRLGASALVIATIEMILMIFFIGGMFFTEDTTLAIILGVTAFVLMAFSNVTITDGQIERLEKAVFKSKK